MVMVVNGNGPTEGMKGCQVEFGMCFGVDCSSSIAPKIMELLGYSSRAYQECHRLCVPCLPV